MVENDYIMRLIREIVRTLLKLIFNIDIEKREDLQIDTEIEMQLKILKKLVDAGSIDQAENKLLDELDTENKQDLQLALLFYEYLNQKENDFLKTHDFSREEVSEGIKNVVRLYGYGSMLEAFTQETE